MGDSNGTTATGFERVRDAFDANFAKGLEIGAAFSAYYRGEKVVDLWGGAADVDRGRVWDDKTLALVFSTTKGATAVCANKLAQEGALDVDAPVARYWPEFAAGGKADIPVSYLLSHQAGLAWVDGEMSLAEALSWDPVVDALAQQVPHYEPGSQHGYHATTYGWLVGEVIRRITAKSVGAYFHDEIAAPLGLDFWIGLPESEEPRVAPLVGGLADPLIAEDPEARAFVNEIMGPHTSLGKALFAPGGALSGPEIWNTRELHAAEVPAANGITDARSIARMYAACIGEVDGIRLLTDEQLRRATTQLTKGPNTVLLDMDIQFGLGFMLRSSLIELGGPRAFGHFGAGGSVGWADPDAELSFGYVMNRMDMGLAGDIRSYELINSCYASLR
ncbi:MAG TPA: serine hydrolase domain-containing protein [Acidimicrobiia bacterium]|jgi:CubicO group peptidase (beta-lactamase class C family)|nr:serine hydrolase domain-containing protein [Acidimicrobiia bacterium]